MHRYGYTIDDTLDAWNAANDNDPRDYEEFDPSSHDDNGLDANLRREPYDSEMTLDVTAFMRLIDAGTFR